MGRAAGRGASDVMAFSVKVVGDPGIEPGVRLREGVTVRCLLVSRNAVFLT